jgi:hypothetical protein
MSESRAQLQNGITNLILNGNNATTATNLRAILNRIVVAELNLNDDTALLGSSRFTEWINTTTYKPGDTVLFGYNLWISLSTNTNITPSPSSDWSLQIINTTAYSGSGSWSGELNAPTLNSVGVQFDNIYTLISTLNTSCLKLTGGTMSGGINMNDNDISGIRRLYIGTYGTVSETMGGLAYITGNSITADPSVNNQVIKSSNDYGHFIRMRYDLGISFHTELAGSIGTAFADNANERFRIDKNANIGINGFDFQSGVGVSYFNDASTQPGGNSSTGSLWWSYNQIMKTNSDIAVDNSAKGYILKDTTNGHYYRLTITNGVLNLPVDLGTSI